MTKVLKKPHFCVIKKKSNYFHRFFPTFIKIRLKKLTKNLKSCKRKVNSKISEIVFFGIFSLFLQKKALNLSNLIT